MTAAEKVGWRYGMRMWLLCVAAPCLAILAVAAVAASAASTGGAVAATEQRAAEICFPARLWSGGTASPEDRPCDVLGRPAEDGSGYLVLGTLSADAAVCSVPNPYEERGHFVVKCHRVANR